MAEGEGGTDTASPYAGKVRSRVGGRVNVLFLLPFPLEEAPATDILEMEGVVFAIHVDSSSRPAARPMAWRIRL